MLKKLMRFVLISVGVFVLGLASLVFLVVRAEQKEKALAVERGFESVSEMEIAQEAGFETGEGYKQHLAELQAQQEAEAERLALEEETRRVAEEVERERVAVEAARHSEAFARVDRHIRDGGSYGLINLIETSVDEVIGLKCSQALEYMSTNRRIAIDYGPLGFLINGADERMFGISTPAFLGDGYWQYRTGCDLFGTYGQNRYNNSCDIKRGSSYLISDYSDSIRIPARFIQDTVVFSIDSKTPPPWTVRIAENSPKAIASSWTETATLGRFDFSREMYICVE